MSARIYTDRKADVRILRGKTCAIIGDGAQGRAHALNLRDSGLRVVVGLRPRSKTRQLAREDGVSVIKPAEAARRGDIIFLALPDGEMPDVYSTQIAPHLAAGKTLLFAHGFV